MAASRKQAGSRHRNSDPRRGRASLQQRGFNGFSYGDVAGELGVTSASLHYHFRGKAELGEALIRRYAARFAAALAEVDARHDEAAEKLVAYAALYADVLRGERMCLCGMLAAEYRTLPLRMQSAVVRFFDENEAWLERVLEEGRRSGSLSFSEPAREVARFVLSTLEGAMLVTRPYGDLERFQAAASEPARGARRPRGGAVAFDEVGSPVVQIRHAEPADYARVIQYVNVWWGGREMAPMLPKLFFLHFEGTSFVAEREDGELMGFLVGFLSQTNPEEAYVHFVGVSPEERGSGVGRNLYEAFFEAARGHGRRIVRCVTSPVNAASVEFHRALGFDVERVAHDYDGPGEDRVLLVKRL